MRTIWLFMSICLFLQCSSHKRKTQQEINYEMMRERFFNDSSFTIFVDQKVAEGDVNMIKLKSTLQLSYNEALQQPGMDSLQVEKIIGTVNFSLDVFGKFRSIDKELEQKLHEADAQYSAEELKAMEALKRAAIDSLRARGELSDSL